MNGRAFDAQVVLSPPDSKLGKLLQQYVCARITTMEGIDIGLFDFDRHNAIYYFLLNADEQIYMRYGGRDAESSSTYLNIRSLELALEQGLDMHSNRAQLDQPQRPEPLYPKQVPMLYERTVKRGSCVECHLIGDFQTQQMEIDGTLDRAQDLFQSPDIKRIGIELKVSKGLLVDQASGAVSEAGMQAGDTITHIASTRVRTFADLQYYYNKVPREAKNLELRVQRADQSLALDVALPARWWVTDLEYRHWTVEPLLYFKTKPLAAEQKSELGLSIDGFAGQVSYVDVFRDFCTPSLEPGDIIYSVEGVAVDEIADTPELYIKLRHRAGQAIKIQVLRGEEKFTAELTSERRSFRK